MFELEKLPFEFDSFEKLSAKSFEIHYLKHHAAYVKNLNILIDEKKINCDLEQIVFESFQKSNESSDWQAIFNNAAQHWNHSFFWNSLSPFKTDISYDLMNLIKNSFGSFDKFKEIFISSGLKKFGSGWVWLVYDQNKYKLDVFVTSNAENPLVYGKKALLVCDLWEHAYYVDFLNNRGEFLNVVFEYFNWDFVMQNLDNK